MPRRLHDLRATPGRIADAYRAGESVRAVADRFGAAPATIYSILRANKVTLRNPSQSSPAAVCRQCRAVAKLLARNTSKTIMATDLGVTRQAVYQIITRCRRLGLL